MTNEKVFSMPFSNVYPLLVQKAERKGRTKAEVDEIIFWRRAMTKADYRRNLKSKPTIQHSTAKPRE